MPTTPKNMWALLIGVDCYMANRLPSGTYYPSLTGCVRDIAHVERFLRTRLGLPDQRILKLTASNVSMPPNDADPERKPAEPPECWPTYDNIVAMFKRLVERADSGHQVYIQYSGHGGRATTAYPALKGANEFDETLVPTDIGSSEARYLRDVELAYLLKTMVDKGLMVTVVLDSCHSGGATRGNGGAIRRGIGEPDTGQRRTDSLVASPSELQAAWRDDGGSARGLKPGSGWLLEPKGYTLLAACRAQESAFEYPFDGRENNGALTYWLLDSLEQLRPGLSYKTLHDRILSKVHGQFEAQTPQLQGEGARTVFGSDQVQPLYAVPVLQVDSAAGRVRVNAGQAQLVRPGAQFVIYPPGTNTLSSADTRLALAEVQEDPGATDAWATIVSKLRDAGIEPGAQAVLINPGAVRLQRPVILTSRRDIPATIDQRAALQRVGQAMEQGDSGFAPLVGEGQAAAFQVVVSERAEYEIWDAAGVAIANLRPALAIDDPTAPGMLVRRLVHLAKYRNVQELDNHDPLSPLAGQLVVELAGKAATYNRADKPEPQPFAQPGSTPVLNPGEWVFVRIKNQLPRVPGQPTVNVLNITVLDLESNWAISQIYPNRPGAYFVPLDPESDIVLPFRAYLPPGCEATTDIVKVFGTVGTTNFRWLELPALDQPIVPKAATRGGPSSPLDALLAAVVEEPPRARALHTAAYASGEWVTAQVELQVRNA
jgi:Caspase domain